MFLNIDIWIKLPERIQSDLVAPWKFFGQQTTNRLFQLTLAHNPVPLTEPILHNPKLTDIKSDEEH
ncbi:diguanylate cyclase GGDEF domain protein [Desulfovibrio ferrophilus]|uniref:Diguanylate cyclase GGDEF domain protein n=1 Tax=Desulfovibrio ferrophilus TaxID=241368 RepID=A0A2Z6AW67_9BACT|nr:diguanylate cyclase GGDEF domain protein [Desulfovibrio ferrophilus]